MSIKNILENKTTTIKASFAGIATAASLILPMAVQAETTYTVKSGDTLSEIASTHGTTVDKLAKLNKINNIHLIHAGQILELDAATEDTDATPVQESQINEAETSASAKTSQASEVTTTAPVQESQTSEVITSAPAETSQTSEATTAEPTETKTSQTNEVAASAEENQTTSNTSGLSTSDAAAKEFIAQKESGGNYNAKNGQYYGRYQLSDSYLNGDLSEENQERVADAYVSSRYGSWTAAQAFWNANGWY
ncbi:aggregation-promoting factor [Streptococcus mutans]|uniref:aggregation-promoting factor n=1 Tax=Streptococcus mutans TaxID=1309 RepID=UPI001CFD07B9|nr:LysM peptidoglycan-binding domain-containing protein [Streptococcus mutans]MCB4951056.1 LysM peptidoglycan-binding domain-containing protein [Streptococcus mutans]MCB4956404.1 LysM peptidoglycan-binding domain-containing protein [Streptococcus mutans]MCB5121678.1 LysM peptidoglycan-binding domain-containing protein [Streptococcus mutans]MDE8031350.1 LysM peptidoglycan-binding domain-containing protein [Streptococcus mutans]MDT9488508.1 LysM peptidoglycan-binding domain-containing protein [S